MSTVTESPSTTSSRPTLLSATDLALVAAFAALVSALAYIGGIPAGGANVDITLQTVGIGLAGALLGPVRGFLAVALYLGLGAIGLPVFSDHSGGLQAFSSISGGYLWAFPVGALVTGLLVKYVAGQVGKTRALVVFAAALVGSVLVVHVGGIIGMKIFTGESWKTVATYDAPFWVGDVLKAALVAFVAAEVHRAFPQLLRRG